MNPTIRFVSILVSVLCLAGLAGAQTGSSNDLPILFLSDQGGIREVYKMNPDSSGQRRLTFGLPTGFLGQTPPGNVTSARWSPDGRKIVLSRIVNGPSPGIRADVVMLMNADGSNTREITSGVDPALSPDGQKIIFSSCPGSCKLNTVNADGTGRAELPIADFSDSGSYSPDGTKIVFRCYDNIAHAQGICVANSDGSNRQILVPFNSIVSDPVFSPDGTKIAFSQWNGSVDVFNIYVMNADGTGQVNITNASTKCFKPAWSPDGSRIVYARLTGAANSSYEVFSIGVDGQNNMQLTQNTIFDYAADWRRVPRQPSRTLFDFDGDSRADISVFRPSNNIWYVRNETNGYSTMTWGEPGDKLTPADYDGDWKTDIAVWRPSSGTWYIFNSSNRTFRAEPWGVNGDVALPADHNGDGRADLVIYRPSEGRWYVLSSTSPGAYDRTQVSVYGWGTSGDSPMVGDFDGDQRADLVFFALPAIRGISGIPLILSPFRTVDSVKRAMSQCRRIMMVTAQRTLLFGVRRLVRG